MSNNKDNSSNDQSQLALELPVSSNLTREDIVVGNANALAVEMIDRWPDWPGNVVIIAGPTGSGKSHIAEVWSEQASAINVAISELSKLGDDALNERNLVLEDAGPNRIDETALFHTLNAKRANGASLLLTSRSWPTDWNIELADLNSRLRAAQLVELEEPDDELLRMVLFKFFADRQLPIDSNVVDYLVVRMERSLEAANKIVAQLDARGLELKRKITRQMAGEVLSREWDEH